MTTVPKAIKPKTCRVCGSKFQPSRWLMAARVCSQHCALELARAARVKDERKADAVKREKLKSRSEWQAEAQAAVNAFVRLRDAHLPCVSCGRHHDGQYHAGHYRSVGSAPHLRFDVERNLHKQCQPCNTHLHGNLVRYRQALVHRIGLEALEALESDQAPRKYSISDLKTIKTTYAARARELKKELAA